MIDHRVAQFWWKKSHVCPYPGPDQLSRGRGPVSDHKGHLWFKVIVQVSKASLFLLMAGLLQALATAARTATVCMCHHDGTGPPLHADWAGGFPSSYRDTGTSRIWQFRACHFVVLLAS